MTCVQKHRAKNAPLSLMHLEPLSPLDSVDKLLERVVQSKSPFPPLLLFLLHFSALQPLTPSKVLPPAPSTATVLLIQKPSEQRMNNFLTFSSSCCARVSALGLYDTALCCFSSSLPGALPLPLSVFEVLPPRCCAWFFALFVFPILQLVKANTSEP